MNFTLQNITHRLLNHDRKIAAAISIILIILISLSVADSVLTILEAASPPTTNPKTAIPNQPKNETIYKVSDLELFGKLQELRSFSKEADAPTTKLNLELQGVFIAENTERSTAIVSERNKSGELFEIGERLPGNAILSAVFEDHILIRRGSRMEKLMFTDNKYQIEKITSGRQGTIGTNQRKDQENLANFQKIQNPIHQGGGASSTTMPESNDDTLDTYRKKFQTDPKATLGSAGFTAVSDGESKGYRVGNDAQKVIRQAGLQPGDVVLSVNGRAVGVASSDGALIDQVMNASRVRVEVQRGNRRFFLTVPVPK